MAESPSHKFGQIIGNLLEGIMQPVLREFCDKRGLYLDVQGQRAGVRKGKKVSWTDKYGNSHDLDFVIEKGGSATELGRPVAFIEAAWRRYTKHSRNKAQEVQAAILPIADEYWQDKPFLGAVLAGEFTQGSIGQLDSVGFRVLHFQYESIMSAFESVGINARFNEETPDIEFKNRIAQIEALSDQQHQDLKQHLVTEEKDLFDKFLADLAKVLDRVIERLIVIPLFGNEHQFQSVTEAVNFISNFDEVGGSNDFKKFEIVAKYSNGDTIDASFTNKDETERFLKYLGQ